MSKFTEASDNIKRLGKMFKGLMEFSEELERLGSIDNHFEEIKAQKDAGEKELEQLKRDVEFQKGNLECAKVEAADLVKQGEATAKMLVDQAQVKCDALLEEADKNYKGCKQAACELKEKSEVAYAQASEKLALLNSEIAEKEVKLADVKRALEQIKGGI